MFAEKGIVASKDVEVYWDLVDNTDTLDVFIAKSDGTWAGIFKIPAETPNGIYHLWAKDVTTGVIERAEIN